MKLIGFIIEQKNVSQLGKKREYAEWVRFSSKIYTTKEIAKHAYKQCPYGDRGSDYNGGNSGYNMEGRIIPVYCNENESPILIKN